jgi:deoxyribonuclease IV
MPLFGAHMSIAGGLHKSLLAAQAHGMDTVQLFTASPQSWPVKPFPAGQAVFQSGQFLTKNANQWKGKELTDEEVRTFRRTLRQTRLRFPLAHDSYLINLASPDEALYRRSLEAFVVELQRAERLGLRYLVTHPGAHIDSGEEAGLARVARALDEVHQRCSGFRVQVLLETTAGQGSTLGHRFEHLARILSLAAEPDRVGVCLDTCHVFAAGYSLAPEKEYRATMKTFDQVIGLRRLRAFHVNDSLKPHGSRVDRHAHIGRGELGLEPFRLLVNDRRFRNRPMVLETPKEDPDTDDMDAVNLALLRSLVRPAQTAR